MRLLHCADVHLDRPFAGLPPEAGRRRTGELFAAFRRVVGLALERDVDVMVIAGDLFEHRWVRPETLRLISAEFDRLAPTPVCIAPGNHDPLVPGSPYRSFRWGENVHIFGPGWSAVELPVCTVWGRGFDCWEVGESPLAGFRVPADGRVHVLVTHGSAVAGRDPDEGPYAPFTAAEALETGAGYIALGHVHSHQVVARRADGAPLACYPGSPEGLDFGQQGSHGALLVHLDGTDLQVELLPVGLREFVRAAVGVAGCATHDEVAGRVRAAFPPGDRQRHLYRVVLEGRYARDLGDLDPGQVGELLAGDFYHLVLESTAGPDWDLDAVARGRDLAGGFVRRLQARMALAADPRERRRLERAVCLGLTALEREGGAP